MFDLLYCKCNWADVMYVQRDILMRVRVTTVTVEMQEKLHVLSLCLWL